MSIQTNFPSPSCYGTSQELSSGYRNSIISSPNSPSNLSPLPQSRSGRTGKVSKVNLVRGIINACYRHVVTPDGAHFLMPIDGGPVLIPETEIVAPLIKKIVADYSQRDVTDRSILDALDVILKEQVSPQVIGNGRTWLGQNLERYIELNGTVMMFPTGQEIMTQPQNICPYWHPDNSRSFQAPPMQGDIMDLKKIESYITLPKDRELLIYTYLTLCLMPDKQQLALEITGERSSDVSKLQQLIKNLVDPVRKETAIRDTPKTVKEIDRYAWRHHAISLEDIEDRLSPVVQRRLFEYLRKTPLNWKPVGCHESTSTLMVSRTCILSSSEPIITYDALSDMTLSLEMPPLSYTQQISPSFSTPKQQKITDRLQAPIFNALLSLLGKVHAQAWRIRIEREVPSKWRDFCRIGVIVSSALTKSDTLFWLQYDAYRKERLCEITEEEPVAQAIIDYIRINDIKEAIEKPAKAWFATLAKHQPTWANESKWPREPRGLGSALKRIAPLLEAQRITCYSNGKRGSNRHWVIGPRPPSLEEVLGDIHEFL
ncbi:hypothetical protein [Halomonas sp.]|uniref:hypothetical protein n=1 Tax=Halomonas sp. TaxID=1486246 RepID=UPI003A91425B